MIGSWFDGFVVCFGFVIEFVVEGRGLPLVWTSRACVVELCVV